MWKQWKQRTNKKGKQAIKKQTTFGGLFITKWLSETLVHDLWVAVVALEVHEDVVGAPAAEVAEAGLHPHDLPGEAGAVGAEELHVDGLGLVGAAAAVVGAHAAVLGPVEPRADAA